MFRWFRSWLERRRMRGRGLYGFWCHDLQRWRWADPLQVYRRFEHHPRYNPERHLALAEHGAEPETSELLDIIADAFEVRRFDGHRGYTDAELFGLWGDFGDWLTGQKKSSSSGLTSQLPTESPSSIGPGDPGEPMPASWGCGSAGRDPNSASPGEPSMGPERRSTTA